MIRMFSIPRALSAAAAASPAGPAPTMSTASPLSLAVGQGVLMRVKHRLQPRAAIEALAAPEHRARAALQTGQSAGRERRGERVPHLSQADALAMAEHLGIGGIGRDARAILPGPRRCF